MAYETVVVSDKINNARTGSRSVTYLIRQNTTVRAAEVILESGQDADVYGETNAAALYAGGAAPNASVSPLALFFAMQAKRAEPYFLNVIFKAFQQLKLGGGLAEMTVAGREALGEDDTLYAQWQAFETAYNAGSDAHRATLNAMAVWVALNIIVAR